MSILLQSNELNEDLYWIVGALIVLLVIFFLTKRAQHTQRAREIGNQDPRANAVNDSNYNINQEGIDGHKTEGMDAGEAREVVDKMNKTDYIPTDEEFRDLRKDMDDKNG